MAEKCFCYCIGGTGARIAEVAAHLCAMNLVNDEREITFIIVDKDQNCGGTAQATEVIGRIENISQITGSNTGACLCKSRLTKPDANPWDFTNALASIAGNNNGNAPLANALGQNGTNDGILFDAFYSDSEQNSGTSEGFYGHPTIGALMFKYMMKNANGNDIAQPVIRVLSGTADTAKVFIIGSIFGGTGAAVFSNLAAHIRSKARALANSDGNANNQQQQGNIADKRNRLIISGVLLLPYFSFSNNRPNNIINETEFYAKSKTALEQYGKDPHLIRRRVDSDNSFDTLYICGQNPLHKVGEYSIGGESQKNHFDLVDLVSAYAMVSFFNEDMRDGANNIDPDKIGKIYEYRLNNNRNVQLQKVESTVLPDSLALNLRKMLLFSAFVLSKVWVPYKLHSDITGNKSICDDIRMVGYTYDPKELSNGLFNNNAAAAGANRTAINAAFANLRSLYNYCLDYIRFAGDIAHNGMNRANDGELGYEGDYELLDKDDFKLIEDLCHYIETGNTVGMTNQVNIILNIDFAKHGKTIMNIENDLQVFFSPQIKANYKRSNISPENRFGDYINKAFEICFANGGAE